MKHTKENVWSAAFITAKHRELIALNSSRERFFQRQQQALNDQAHHERASLMDSWVTRL